MWALKTTKIKWDPCWCCRSRKGNNSARNAIKVNHSKWIRDDDDRMFLFPYLPFEIVYVAFDGTESNFLSNSSLISSCLFLRSFFHCFVNLILLSWFPSVSWTMLSRLSSKDAESLAHQDVKRWSKTWEAIEGTIDRKRSRNQRREASGVSLDWTSSCSSFPWNSTDPLSASFCSVLDYTEIDYFCFNACYRWSLSLLVLCCPLPQPKLLDWFRQRRKCR